LILIINVIFSSDVIPQKLFNKLLLRTINSQNENSSQSSKLLIIEEKYLSSILK